MHRRFLTPAQQETLSTRYPHGPRAQIRFLLDHYDNRPDVLASLLGMRHWAARRLARGWSIPLSYARRDQLRSRVLRLVCPLCQKEDQAEREREAARGKEALDIRRKIRQARHRAM
ncbi:hypothetical protein OOK13_41490 [Streptomyces sp. NBC_00378]|uniref:hypothetical protein n=1 Tax=unclassified Streptomyces TaxID=2593676 RepID=UPI00225B9BFD|nr:MULTISPECIES: hypothetical protein [unclassified Streptomyces]MCX5114816.1 hypothetical protein [Streptomyces sp. NBC_00378]